jgi:hypothetical protein
VDISIYSIGGRKVSSLVDRSMNPGNYSIVWNGKSSGGLEMSSGVYLVVLKTEREKLQRKVLFLK